MRRITDWLRGWCEIIVDGADLQGCLNRLTAAGIPFWSVDFADEFTLRICIYTCDLGMVKSTVQCSMCNLKCVRFRGLPKVKKTLQRRIPFVLFLLIVLGIAHWTSVRIWFFTVEGNKNVPSARIIRAVNESGVPVGTKRKQIDPQLVKDRVLEKMPELAWLTVTQRGARATIVVREKQQPLARDDRRVVRNMIASQDGVIEELEVLDGSAVVKHGDVVKKGDLLISGYMDLEYKIRATRADGEVYARTWRDFTIKSPLNCYAKRYNGRELKKFSLIFGNNQINLSSSSGIITDGCDKMTEYVPLTLPGGLKLPLTLVKEVCRFYDHEPHNLDASAVRKMLAEETRVKVEKLMVAGSIQNHTENVVENDQLAEIDFVFECREMIASPAEVGIFKDE